MFRPSSTAVAINATWFLSLTFSLMSALIALLAQHWLRQYDSYPPQMGPRERAILRQQRFVNLELWRVRDTLYSVTVLLQLGMFMFFVGLVILLWSLDPRVAIPVTAVAGLFFLLFMFMAALSVFSPSSPHKNPLTWAVSRVLARIMLLYHRARRSLFTGHADDPIVVNLHQYKYKNWAEREVPKVDTFYHDALVVQWVCRKLPFDDVHHIAACLIEHYDSPSRALLQWMCYISHETLESVLSKIRHCYHHNWPQAWLRSGPESNVTSALLDYACQYAVSFEDWQDLRPVDILHLMRWLGKDVTTAPQYAINLLNAAKQSGHLVNAPPHLHIFIAQGLFTLYHRHPLNKIQDQGTRL
jgi:hypothetical protein